MMPAGYSFALQHGPLRRVWDWRADPEGVAEAIKAGSLDLLPLLLAVRDAGVVLSVADIARPIVPVPRDRAGVVLILDNIGLGPSAFDQEAIADYRRRCEGRVILVSNPHHVPFAYADAATTAAGRAQSVLVVRASSAPIQAEWRSFFCSMGPAPELIVSPDRSVS